MDKVSPWKQWRIGLAPEAEKPAEGDGWWHPKQEPEAGEGDNYPEKKHKGSGSAAGHSHAYGPQTFILGRVAPKCKQCKVSY